MIVARPTLVVQAVFGNEFEVVEVTAHAVAGQVPVKDRRLPFVGS